MKSNNWQTIGFYIGEGGELIVGTIVVAIPLLILLPFLLLAWGVGYIKVRWFS